MPARIKRRRARLRSFAAALSDVYAIQPGWQQWLTDDTVVCRCEEVTARELRRATAERGADGLRALRLTSRAGLGLCQGRVCSAMSLTWPKRRWRPAAGQRTAAIRHVPDPLGRGGRLALEVRLVSTGTHCDPAAS